MSLKYTVIAISVIAILIAGYFAVDTTPVEGPSINYQPLPTLGTAEIDLRNYESLVDTLEDKDIESIEIHDENHVEINGYDFFLDTNEVTYEGSPLAIHNLDLEEGLSEVGIASREELISTAQTQADVGIAKVSYVVNLGITPNVEDNFRFYAFCATNSCSQGLLYAERDTSVEEIYSGNISSGSYVEEVFSELNSIDDGQWFEFKSSSGFRI